MLIVPNEKIKKYVAYSAEEGGWIHDPKMPAELVGEFEKFKKIMDAESTAPVMAKEFGGGK
ncbi:MAG: hypothetical protein PUB52_02085 [Lachnospiraceae bacterium]|nr:hypothetical protein [Lachnospiraceae bacterium]